MRTVTLYIAFLLFALPVFAQPANDQCSNAKVIREPSNYCSADREFSTVSAADNDVWFQFTARAFDVNVSAGGNMDGSGNMGGTLQSPVVELYASCNSAQIAASIISSDNVTTLYKGGLIIGNIYYIRVSGANNGTFKLCLNNYNPIVKPGQDCGSASYLCSKESFTQTDVTGSGLNNNEAAGTCLDAFGVASEQNSAWYKWTAANNGTLTFTITPTANDDIDWVLYDLGTVNDCAAANASNAIRCNAGRGVDCFGPGQNRYTKTGLNLTSTDLSENGGCLQGQDGFVKYVDMQQGHIYALLVNNFDRGNNGFTIEFGGSGEFSGPLADIDMVRNDPCTRQQSYTFTSRSENYLRLKWTFGEGASIDSASTPGPFTVTYATPGVKTVVLQAFGDKGCSVVTTQSFVIGLKPALPAISINQPEFCLGDTVTLSTPLVPNASYRWTGPNGFSADQPTVNIPADNYNRSGVYSLVITIDECSSDVSSITVPPIRQTPVAAFTITENNPCTFQQSYTISSNSSDYQQLQWDFGEGASVAPSGGEGPFTVQYSSPGVRTITLLARGNSGCTVSLIKTLEVPPVPPQPEIVANKLNFCLKDTLRLSTAVLPNTVYLWTGPDNFRSDKASVIIPVSSFAVAGTYTLVITQGRCSSQPVSVTIPAIAKNPTAAFTSLPQIPAKLSFPITVKFFNQSEDADAYLWDFGDGGTSTEVNPEHEYTRRGDYTVTLTAFKSNLCNTSLSRGKFVIRETSTLFIPNTFTPNGDNINDEFVITITNLQSYKIQIFNRYGSPLFQANNIFDNWKGLYNGEPLPVGTYYYIIDAVGLDGNVIKKAGPITLIR